MNDLKNQNNLHLQYHCCGCWGFGTKLVRFEDKDCTLIIVIVHVLEYTGHTKFIDSMSYDEEMPSSNLSQGMCYLWLNVCVTFFILFIWLGRVP